MLTRVRILLITAITLAAAAAGCATHQQNKNAAAARWDKMSSQMKIAVAQQQFDNGKYIDAAKTIGECLKADPNMPKARLLAGKIVFMDGQTDVAIAEMKRAVELDPKLSDGWYWLGIANEEKGQVVKAYEYYQKALDLSGSNIDYILSAARASAAIGKTAEAIALLNQKMAVFPADVDLKAKCADLLSANGQYDEAIALYRQAAMLSPKREDIAESFGYCCVLAQKWSDAAQVFAKLSESCSEPSKKSGYLQLLGMCQVNAGQYGGAMTSLSKLDAKQRDNAQVWLRMGQAALGAGDAQRAYAFSKRALALDPDFADAIELKGSAEYLDKKYNEAVQTFQKIVGDPQRQSFAWTMLSKCYERLGDDEKAKQAAQKARTISKCLEMSDLLAKIDE